MKASVNIWILMFLSFIIYFILGFVYKKFKVGNIQNGLMKCNGLCLLNAKHVLGIILFGAIYYILYPDFRVLIHVIQVPRFQVLLPMILVVVLSAYLSGLSVSRMKGQFAVPKEYSYLEAIFYFMFRGAFLLAYEFFFRGILFYESLETYNLTLSIIINTSLYVLIHAFDSQKEIFGAIPFGIVLCLFTYYTNSIWPAFIIHLALCLTYEISLFNIINFKTQKS